MNNQLRTSPLLFLKSPPHDAAGIYSFLPIDAITLISYVLSPTCFCIWELSPYCAWTLIRRRTIPSTTLSLSMSHPSDSSGSTLSLVMSIGVISPCHLPPGDRLDLSSPPAAVPQGSVFALYRSLFRNHQPNGTPFKVCGIAAPWRALAEDHRYLALAELRERTASWGPFSHGSLTRAGRMFIRVLECCSGKWRMGCGGLSQDTRNPRGSKPVRGDGPRTWAAMLEVRYRGQCLKIDSFKEVWARQWGVEEY